MEFHDKTELKEEFGSVGIMNVLLLGLLGVALAVAQNSDDVRLARLLAGDTTREAAVRGIVNSGAAKVPLLLAWARRSPSGVDRVGLSIGLAEAFGRLKTIEAVPFLIRNIGLECWPPSPDTWTKTPEVIEERMPAVAALVDIGPAAARALLKTGLDKKTFEERLAVIFIVSRVHGVPESRAFLTMALGQANLERHWAESGLRVLSSETPPPR